MTETSSILGVTQNRRVYAPPDVARPGVLTFMAQAVIGWTFGCFLLLTGAILIVRSPDNFAAVFGLPILVMLGLMVGSPVGLGIWLFAKFSDQPLSSAHRSTIAILLLAIGWFAWMLATFPEAPTSKEKLFLVLWVVVPGLTIGIFSGSGLRAGRELIRAGEAQGILSRVIAGLTGVVLRVQVALLFMASVIAAISTLQSYYYKEPYFEQLDPRWIALAFGHFTLGVIALFARMKFESLALLTLIANAPLIASFWMYPAMPAELRYWMIGYLITWAIFLLTRWRQTDVALAVLKKELRYYLID